MKKAIIKPTLAVVAVAASCFGTWKAYDAFNDEVNSLLMANVEVLGQDESNPYRNKYLFYIYIILRTAKDHRMKRCWYYTKGKIAGKFFNPKIEME